jgi:hypothetical protein
VTFRLTVIQVFLLATNGMIFKSNEVSPVSKFRYGVAMVLICVLIIAFTIFRLVQDYFMRKKVQLVKSGHKASIVVLWLQLSSQSIIHN